MAQRADKRGAGLGELRARVHLQLLRHRGHRVQPRPGNLQEGPLPDPHLPGVPGQVSWDWWTVLSSDWSMCLVRDWPSELKLRGICTDLDLDSFYYLMNNTHMLGPSRTR